jgi:hypothetical protein
MSYIGTQQGAASPVLLDSITAVTGQADYTLQKGSVNYSPASSLVMEVSLNGVTQAPEASYTISGSTLTFASNLIAGDVIDYVLVREPTTGAVSPVDGSVTTNKIANDAVTTNKIANGAVTAAKLAAGAVGSSSNIKEQFTLVANGESIAVGSGTYTPANVTATQAVTNSHVVISGSSLTYTPPSGTTDVIYEFEWTINKDTTVSQLAHFAMRIDGTQITGTRQTYAAEGTYDNQRIAFQWRIPIGGSASTTTGRVASWSSAKTLDMTIRRYGSGYTSQLHRLIYWDGAANTLVRQPIIKITALG